MGEGIFSPVLYGYYLPYIGIWSARNTQQTRLIAQERSRRRRGALGCKLGYRRGDPRVV